MSKNTSEPLEFILLVGRSLHSYGAAAHHIEAALQGLSAKYCEDGEFFVTPTAIISSVKIDGEWQSRLQRVNPGGIDLGRLSLLDEIGDKVINGHMNMLEGIKRINKIAEVTESTLASLLLRIFFFVIASVAFGSFFVFRWLDLLVIAILSLLASVTLEISNKLSGLSQISEFVVPFLVAFAALIFSHYWYELPVKRVILSSLIVLIPGLSLTIALSEIGTKNWLAGTSRLMGAAAELLKITFGVVLGGLLAHMIIPTSMEFAVESRPFLIPEQVILLCAAQSFAVLFNCLKRDYVWVITGACVSYYGAKFGAYIFGQELGVFLGGACLAAFSNAFARFLQRPALTVLIPGLIPMVPGSIGFNSLTFVFHQDVMGAMTSTFSLVIVAVSLVAGLTIGNMIVHPRRSI